ncbi:nucleotide exchange factor SIL1 [Geosmithia morbida]|uniref:Nucleotide exchange factor SIL1 n=1 Tax=Geosmithia morbida TaxID=1094350 RepID=A0A9P4YSW6_9HYPO|nr:nucleotide exchange factor SIL1 [Geosmithia morbida]KAF4122511.1 nucleotide exchange factor SIL1 [Geosmithia morbida]
MPSSRRSPSPSSPLLVILLIALLCLLPAPALAKSPAPPPAASPSQQASAENDIICHTSNPDECYHRIFRPTDDFQVVHDDQEIPKGLHVRLNMSTGKREAKINVADEVPAELVGLDKDQAVMVIDQDQGKQEPQVPPGAPEYESVGKIKEPKNDAQFFHEALGIVKAGAAKRGGEAVDVALESLEDISHDIYYGLKITEDTDAVKALLCLMAGQDGSDGSGKPMYDRQAASVLAGALSNNPAALREMTGAWPLLMGDACPGADAPLAKIFYSGFVPAADSAAQAAAKAKAKVSVVNGLVKSDAIRRDFLESGGMRQLLEVLALEGEEWEGAQRKVGQLALDTFLDEDMGATLGQWPTVDRLDDKLCQAGAGRQPNEGCWDYHVDQIMKANEGSKEHWSRDLSDRLAAARKNQPIRGSGHDEL